MKQSRRISLLGASLFAMSITAGCASGPAPEAAPASGAPAARAPAAAAPAAAAEPMEVSRTVANGGISVQGWTGKIDANEVAAGQVLSNSRLTMEGNALSVTTGPAVTYWNPANRATGNYTVSATFHEPQFMTLNNHPHPYGIVIGGNDLGSANESYLYCAAYGNGRFIVRGFGPAAFQVNGARGEEHAAVNRAAAAGQPVSQVIAVSSTPDKIECSINGTVVGSYDRSAVVTAGRLRSTDGVYGIRFAHNTHATVSNLSMVRR